MPEGNKPKSLSALLRQMDEQGVTGYRRYAEVRKFLSFRAREKGVPISGSFELTPLCNLDCKMCYVHLNKDQMRGQPLLPVEDWKSLMTQAIDAGMMYATLTGGECLTYPGFRELYLFLQDRGIEVSILSNGLLMDDDMADFLKRHPPAIIQITLYGASEQAYEKVTGKRCFSRVMENLERLRRAGLPFRVSLTPSEFSEDGVETVRLLHEMGYAYIINSGLLEPRKETGRTLHEPSMDQVVEMLKCSRALEGKETFPEADADELPQPNTRGEKKTGVRCGAGRSAFSILWDGSMRPCSLFPGVVEYPLRDGFEAAWKSINTQANAFPIPAECFGCKYESVCRSCVVEHAAGAEIGHASPGVCAWGKQLVAEGILRLEAEKNA